MEQGLVQRPIPKDAVAPRGVVLVVERVGRYHRLVDHHAAGALVPVLERVVCALSVRDEAVKVPRTRVLSADRITLSVGGVATVRVADPRLTAYSVEDADATIRLVASHCLRAAAATLPANALRNEPKRLVDATRSRIHDALSQWGCQCTAFIASTVRISDGTRTRSRDKVGTNLRKSPSAAAVSNPSQPETPASRQNKYSARRQGSLLAQHLLDENSRLSSAGTLTGRAAAAAAVAEVNASHVSQKRVVSKGDAPSPGWLVPSPPPGRVLVPHSRKDTRSPAQALSQRSTLARETAAAKRQRAIDNATVAPRRTTTQSPTENTQDKMAAVSRAAAVPEAAPLVIVRAEPKRTSPVPLKSSPPARVHAPVPTRATSNALDLIPSVGSAKVSPRSDGPPSEDGIVFHVSNPSPRNRRVSPQKKLSPKVVEEKKASSPPKQTPNAIPSQMLALPAPGDDKVEVVKEVEDDSMIHGALVSAVSAAMRDITALAASERKQSTLDVSNVQDLPADKDNDLTPSPPPSTPLDLAVAPTPTNRGRKHSSLTRSRKRATRIEVHPASAPASLASTGDDIRHQIALARRASGDVIPASKKLPNDVVVEAARVSIRKSTPSPLPSPKSEKSPPHTSEKVPETNVIEVNDIGTIDVTEKDDDGKIPQSLTSALDQGEGEEEAVTPLSFVIHEGNIPIPLPAPPVREKVKELPETDASDKVEDAQPSSPPQSSIPSNAGSTPPMYFRDDSGNTLTSLPSPVPPPADHLPPAMASTSHDVVAESSPPVSLFRTPPTPTNTIDISPKVAVPAATGSDSSEEPGDPDEDLINDTATEVVAESRADETPNQGSPGSAPDSSPVTNSSDEREGTTEPTLETPTPAPLVEKALVQSSPDRNAHVDMMPVPEEAPRFVPQRSRRPPHRPQRIILDDEDDRHLLYEPRDVEPRRVRRRNDSRTRRPEREEDEEGGDPDEDLEMEQSMVSQDATRDESREERRRRRQERRERKIRREQKRQQIAEYHEQLRAAREAEGEVSDDYGGRRRTRPVIGSDDESDAELEGNTIERPSRWSPPSAEEQQYWREREQEKARDRERERRKRSVSSSGVSSRERKRREREPTPHSRSDRVERERARSSSRGRGDERRTSSGRRKQVDDDTLVRSSSRTRSASASAGAASSRGRQPESWEAETVEGSRRANRLQRSSSREGERKRRSASAGADLRRTRDDDGNKARRLSSERLRPMVPSRSRSALGTPRERASRRRHRSELAPAARRNVAVRPIYRHGVYEDSESDTANARYIPWYCEGQSDAEEDAGDALKCLYIAGGGRFRCAHPRCVQRRKRRRRLIRRGRHVSYQPELVWGDGEAVNGRRY